MEQVQLMIYTVVRICRHSHKLTWNSLTNGRWVSMLSQLVYTNVPHRQNLVIISMADSDDFLDQTKEVASVFLDLYLSPKAILPGQRSPYPGSGNRIREKEGIVVSDSAYEGTSPEAGELPSSLPRKDNAVVTPSPAIVVLNYSLCVCVSQYLLT